MAVVPTLLLIVLSVDVTRVYGLWIQVDIWAAPLFSALLILILNVAFLNIHLACELSWSNRQVLHWILLYLIFLLWLNPLNVDWLKPTMLCLFFRAYLSNVRMIFLIEGPYSSLNGYTFWVQICRHILYVFELLKLSNRRVSQFRHRIESLSALSRGWPGLFRAWHPSSQVLGKDLWLRSIRQSLIFSWGPHTRSWWLFARESWSYLRLFTRLSPCLRDKVPCIQLVNNACLFVLKVCRFPFNVTLLIAILHSRIFSEALACLASRFPMAIQSLILLKGLAR